MLASEPATDAHDAAAADADDAGPLLTLGCFPYPGRWAAKLGACKAARD